MSEATSMVMASFSATALNSHVSCAFGNVWIHNKMNYYSCKTFLPTVATFTPFIYHSCPKENQVCQKCPSLQIYVLGRHLKIEQSPLTNQNFGWIKRPVDKGLGSRKVMRLLNTRIIDKLTQTSHIYIMPPPPQGLDILKKARAKRVNPIYLNILK